MRAPPALFLCLVAAACSSLDSSDLDVVLRNGTIYEGSGGAPYVGDVALRGDRIAAIGRVEGRGRIEWENLLLSAGSPDRVLLNEFKTEALKPLTGQTLAAVARQRD
jgi:hypothetical protein